jgi:hypothetical protein
MSDTRQFPLVVMSETELDEVEKFGIFDAARSDADE